jgi:hypothetical protein
MKLKLIKNTNMLNSSQVIGLSTYAQWEISSLEKVQITTMRRW